MQITSRDMLESTVTELGQHYVQWEIVKDVVDQLIDLILNYRQSGHPGGSRSKVHAFVALLLSGAMRWDIRHPESRFGDRFILSAGHAVPLVYCTMAVLNEAMRLKYMETGNKKYQLPKGSLLWEDLLLFRCRGGLSGHAEMERKTLFLKFNTGPSGHGSAATVGQALALKRAGLGDVRVFAMDGEGGLTPGVNQESMNSAWGLALDNLYFLVDWNDFGIDDHRVSAVVYGKPSDWFEHHGWRVFGTENGSDWAAVTEQIVYMLYSDNEHKAPSVLWFKTRKGRGYGKYDHAAHGTPHAIDSEAFWETKRAFAEKYGVEFRNFGGRAPEDSSARSGEFRSNLVAVMDVMRRDAPLVDYLADRLVSLGDAIPKEVRTFSLGRRGNPFSDQRLCDFRRYPPELFASPGAVSSNRQALAKWGAWVNSFGAREYGRPLFLACSADLAASTNIAGFAEGFGDFEGYGWYERVGGPDGVLLPQEITEFANAGIMVGTASVNLSKRPREEFEGFYGVCSTYAAFSYLKYGMFRLFAQMAQDCPLKLGKVIWIAGHSGPETADDSRTHFGIFSPGCTQLFPKGQIVNLHPWEHNEVPVLLGAALERDFPIIVLHLTRPSITIPDREALGIAPHCEAARGAYLVRDFRTRDHMGVAIVQGTSAMANMIRVLPKLDEEGLDVKVVCATSAELFAHQSEAYQQAVLSPSDRLNSMIVTTQACMLMKDWLFNKMNEEYAVSSDWDGRWRTGGTLEEVLDEAHLSAEWILRGIRRFCVEKSDRRRRLSRALAAM
jgi:transketolase